MEQAVTDERESFLNAGENVRHAGISPGMVIGDFGVGGAAYFSLALSQLVGADGGVIMFDILKPALSGALSLAKMQGAQNCRAVWANLEIYGGAKGIGDASLDGGVAVNLLHQSAKYKDILIEIHRMLKSGAKLLIIDWNPEAETPISPPKDRRLPAERVEQVGQTLGFAALEKFSAGPYHWGLVLVKT